MSACLICDAINREYGINFHHHSIQQYIADGKELALENPINALSGIELGKLLL